MNFRRNDQELVIRRNAISEMNRKQQENEQALEEIKQLGAEDYALNQDLLQMKVLYIIVPIGEDKKHP